MRAHNLTKDKNNSLPQVTFINTQFMNYLFLINVNPFSETINVKACVHLFLQKWCLNPRLIGFSEVMSLNFIANNY